MDFLDLYKYLNFHMLLKHINDTGMKVIIISPSFLGSKTSLTKRHYCTTKHQEDLKEFYAREPLFWFYLEKSDLLFYGKQFVDNFHYKIDVYNRKHYDHSYILEKLENFRKTAIVSLNFWSRELHNIILTRTIYQTTVLPGVQLHWSQSYFLATASLTYMTLLLAVNYRMDLKNSDSDSYYLKQLFNTNSIHQLIKDFNYLHLVEKYIPSSHYCQTLKKFLNKDLDVSDNIDLCKVKVNDKYLLEEAYRAVALMLTGSQENWWGRRFHGYNATSVHMSYQNSFKYREEFMYENAFKTTTSIKTRLEALTIVFGTIHVYWLLKYHVKTY